jgi:hypothetical protein
LSWHPRSKTAQLCWPVRPAAEAQLCRGLDGELRWANRSAVSAPCQAQTSSPSMKRRVFYAAPTRPSLLSMIDRGQQKLGDGGSGVAKAHPPQTSVCVDLGAAQCLLALPLPSLKRRQMSPLFADSLGRQQRAQEEPPGGLDHLDRHLRSLPVLADILVNPCSNLVRSLFSATNMLASGSTLVPGSHGPQGRN